jgi:hypothetical protein
MSFMLSVAIKHIMLSVAFKPIMLSVAFNPITVDITMMKVFILSGIILSVIMLCCSDIRIKFIANIKIPSISS